MKWIDNPVDKVTGENEPAVAGVFFHKVAQRWLGRICIKIVSFVENNILSSACERHSRSEVSDVGSECVDIAIH